MSTPPEKFENALQQSVYKFLADNNIPFARVDNEPCVSMDDCRAIDAALDAPTVKTILLTNRQHTRFFLLVMPADKPFVTKDFSRALEVPRMSFASPELLDEKLGVPHGAASPVCILHPGASDVKPVIDSEVLAHPRICFTDGTLHGFIRVDTSALATILPGALTPDL